MHFDVHVWLQNKQISHTENARINRGRVLYFEGSRELAHPASDATLTMVRLQD